jgi:indole-3-glycerol phosphate synthase
VDTSTTIQLAPLVPENCVLVSESGISHKEDIKGLKGSKVNAVLVGSALMSSENPGEKVKELFEAGKHA